MVLPSNLIRVSPEKVKRLKEKGTLSHPVSCAPRTNTTDSATLLRVSSQVVVMRPNRSDVLDSIGQYVVQELKRGMLTMYWDGKQGTGWKARHWMESKVRWRAVCHYHILCQLIHVSGTH